MPQTGDPDVRFKRAQDRADGAASAAIASKILAAHRDSIDGATNPHSGSNDVWITTRHVLRVSRDAGDDALHREARLAPLLPAEVGYPPVVASGVADDRAWLLVERLPATNLWDAWPTLGRQQRLKAVDDLWRRARLLAQVPTKAAAELGVRGPSKYPFDAADFVERLDRLVSAGVLNLRTAERGSEAVENGRAHLDEVPVQLVHSDIGMTNVLCAGGNVIALIDFEAAAIGPADLDLEYLLRGMSDPLGDPPEPGSHGMPSPGAFDGVWSVLVEAAQPLLRLPGARERLIAYAVLFDVAVLEGQLRRGWAPARVRRYRGRLVDIVTSGGYLASLWD